MYDHYWLEVAVECWQNSMLNDYLNNLEDFEDYLFWPEPPEVPCDCIFCISGIDATDCPDCTTRYDGDTGAAIVHTK